MTAMTLQAPHVKARLRHFVSRAVAEIEIPSSWSVQDATQELVRAIELPLVDGQNRRQTWDLFARRADGSAERLPPSSTIGESVRELDELEPMPEVMPGGC
jgi:hypothetical protein